MRVTSKRPPALDILGWASVGFAILAGICALNASAGNAGLGELPAAGICTLLAAGAIVLGAWARRRARKRGEAMSHPAIYGLVFGILTLIASQLVVVWLLLWWFILG